MLNVIIQSRNSIPQDKWAEAEVLIQNIFSYYGIECVANVSSAPFRDETVDNLFGPNARGCDLLIRSEMLADSTQGLRNQVAFALKKVAKHTFGIPAGKIRTQVGEPNRENCFVGHIPLSSPQFKKPSPA